ncbi:hypothetical protein BGX24_011333 [Mortierella sp. AD032]|nr:hypothetical protein BGX24_011333 [Mortierella sp. AD032]
MSRSLVSIRTNIIDNIVRNRTDILFPDGFNRHVDALIFISHQDAPARKAFEILWDIYLQGICAYYYDHYYSDSSDDSDDDSDCNNSGGGREFYPIANGFARLEVYARD